MSRDGCQKEYWLRNDMFQWHDTNMVVCILYPSRYVHVRCIMYYYMRILYCLFRQIKRVVSRHWQIANKMNRRRGTLPGTMNGNENGKLVTSIPHYVLYTTIYTLHISSFLLHKHVRSMDVHNNAIVDIEFHKYIYMLRERERATTKANIILEETEEEKKKTKI